MVQKSFWQSGDFLHVSDLASAYLFALQAVAGL